MKPLADYDAIALIPAAQPRSYSLRIHTSLPKARLVDAGDKPAQIAALRAMQGAYVLWLPEDFLPGSTLPARQPDPLLLEAGYRIGWMAKNPITGQCDGFMGPELLPRDMLLDAWEAGVMPESPRATMPEALGEWAFNYGSRPAFYAAFSYANWLEEQKATGAAHDKDITIAATFGGDEAYADWWHLGLMVRLAGGKVASDSYAREKAVMAAGAKMQDRLQDLRRKLNATRGLALQHISRENAAFFRAHRTNPARPAAYAALADAYQPLGKAGKKTAANWREAARWVWGVRI